MFLWLIAAYGMSNILVYGSIFEGFRNNIHSMSNTDIPLLHHYLNSYQDL